MLSSCTHITAYDESYIRQTIKLVFITFHWNTMSVALSTQMSWIDFFSPLSILRFSKTLFSVTTDPRIPSHWRYWGYMWNSCGNQERYRLYFHSCFRKTLLYFEEKGRHCKMVVLCIASVINYHKLNDLNNTNLLSYSSGSHKSKLGLMR